ncbi:DUF4142 domain-containing protein [Pseudacidovorax intermedius]|uniref:DUF4142 domain-containing protein n=1 Tax=Pseudacidovorax intermedius TaxID=433924 RepID=UPI0012DF0734|nr:DUF4142 domain-containing protein [Pseudacidovorax intermedius]
MRQPLFVSPSSPHRPDRRRLLVLVAAGCTCTAFSAAHAQPNSKDPDDATLRGDMSNGDRVFLRSAGGLIVRDREIGKLGQRRFQKPALREWAASLEKKSDALYRDMTDYAERHKTNLPLDMSEASRRMVDRVAESKGATFDRDMVRTVRALLEEQVRVFSDSAESAEHQAVAALARRAADDRRALLQALDKAAPRS